MSELITTRSAACLLVCGALFSTAAQARATDLDRTVMLDIAAQPLETALVAFSQQANIQVVLNSGSTGTAAAAAVKGTISARTGLAELLKGTGFYFEPIGNRTVSVMAVEAGTAEAAEGPRGRDQFAQADNASARGENQLPSAANNTGNSVRSNNDRVTLQEIIVTASRRAEALQNVAMAATVLDPTDFARSGLTSLSAILPFVPGVAVIDSGRSFGSNIIVRGINAAQAAGVGTYIDDIPYGSSTPYAGGGSPVDGVLLDLRQMSLLKGPQGTLYGASAMGGLLKFETRNPSLTDWGGSISTDLSSTEQGGLNQLYRLAINGPLAESTAVSLTAFWKDKAGYIDNTVIPFSGYDDYEYYGGSGSLLFAPSDRLEIKLQGFYQRSQEDGRAAIPANNVTGAPLLGKFVNGDVALSTVEFESKLIGATIKYDFEWAELTSVTSYQEQSNAQQVDRTRSFAPLLDQFFPGNAPHTSVRVVADTGFDKSTQELRLTSPTSERFEWIVGGFYSLEDGFNVQELVSVPAEPNFFKGEIPTEYEELAVFATGTYYLTRDVDASVGVRYSDNSMTVESIAVGPLTQGLPLNTSEDEVTTLLFNVRYRPTQNVSLYARVASGYRPGGANLVGLDVNGNPLAPPTFEADELWNYELGVKGQAGRRFQYDLSAFDIEWNDFQIGVSRNGFTVIGNAEKARSRGLEAAAEYAMTDRFSINGTLAFIDAQLSADDRDLGGAQGDQLPGSPQWSGTLSLRYGFDVMQFPAFVGTSYRYNGEFPVGFDGVTIGSTFFPSSAPRYVNDSYDVVDLRAGISTDRFDLTLYATNLLNEYAYSYFSTASVGPATATVLRPRTVGITVGVHF